MKSVSIIMGGIRTVIAVVFLAPQKRRPPLRKTRHPSLSMKLTPSSLPQKEAEEQASCAELYAERKDWIDNFPFQRRYRQNLVFDPENTAHSTEKFHACQKELEKESGELRHSIPDREAEIWARTDLSLEEKHEECYNLYLKVEESRKPDPEIMEQRRILMRRKRLAGFYAQHYRSFPELEQAYRIFEEEDAGDNPVQIADTIVVALEMHKEASKHDPNELHQYFEGLIEGKKAITYECNFLPDETPTSREQAERIAKRLVEEIPADGFTGQTFMFGMMNPKDEDLVPRQSLLAE